MFITCPSCEYVLNCDSQTALERLKRRRSFPPLIMRFPRRLKKTAVYNNAETNAERNI